jgi:hypothetical protein
MDLVKEFHAREWAKAKCRAWNWNANVAEIAHELIEEDIDKNSDMFVTLGEEFIRFYGDSMPSGQAELFWEIIGQIIETFG